MHLAGEPGQRNVGSAELLIQELLISCNSNCSGGHPGTHTARAAHLAGEPRQRDVGSAERVVARPAALLQLERRRAVDVGDEAAEYRQLEQDWRLVPCPPGALRDSG